jgi:cell division initiation protein
MQAEAIMNEAKTKARNTIEESDTRAKEILAEMEDRLKALVENYRTMIATRDDLLTNIKHLSTDALERVEKARASTKDFDPDKHLAAAKREAKRAAFPNSVDTEKKAKAESAPIREKEKEIIFEQRTLIVEPQPKKVQKSFFDEIG